MKFLVFLPLLFLSLYALSQDSVDFRTTCLPQHVYHNTSVQTSTETLRIDSASQEVLGAHSKDIRELVLDVYRILTMMRRPV